jgi:hypothetical protein
MMDTRRAGTGPFGSGPALFALAVALTACSAKTGNSIGGSDVPGNVPSGSGATPGAGNSPNGGSNPGGGFLSQGATSGGILTVGNGGTTGAVGGASGAAGGPPTTSDGHIGPAMINNCADASKFQNASGAVQMLYPYDGTVFPRALSAPLLMWDANVSADQIYIEAHSGKWTYVDCPQTPDKIRFQLDNNVWKGAASYSDGPADPVVMKISILSGGKVLGPVTLNLKFALASLKGAIYYNTYGSMLANNNGAVLKLIPGDAQPTLFLTDNGVGTTGPCRSCHSLSANGTTMTVNHHNYGFPASYKSESYNVTGATPTLVFADLPEAGFAGVFPDGSRLMTNGPPNNSISAFFPTAPGDVGALVPSTSKMLDTKTGNTIMAAGWDVQHAQMPTFSPDGKHIVYNDYDKGPQTMVMAPGNQMFTVGGHELWVQDFDAATNTFSNPRKLYSDMDLYPAWPFFTPDSARVVFAAGSRPDFVSQVPDPLLGPPAMTPLGSGHLMIADLASGMVWKLDSANGYAGGKSYLPAGEDRDNNLEFFPTVSPLSGGGFAWVLFTSRRTYGNLWTTKSDDPTSKKIWVTAVNMGLPAGMDPSNPAFLLPGQELNSGNIRAFAALEPCKEDGQPCKSGADCCKGFCSMIDPATGIGVCGKEKNPPPCSRVDERCTMDSDCCQDANNGVLGRRLFCISTAGTAFCEQKVAQ